MGEPSAFEIWDHACHAITKLPEGWRGNLFDVVGNHPHTQGVMVTGAVSPPRLAGPRKGTPNWPKRDRKTERKVFISHEAYDVSAKALGGSPRTPKIEESAT
jgi:hypothetical protein